MSLRFPKAGDPDAVVGQTAWSARVPLDPLLASEIRFIQTQQADVGVGCGPGGPPHSPECYWSQPFGLPAKRQLHIRNDVEVRSMAGSVVL